MILVYFALASIFIHLNALASTEVQPDFTQTLLTLIDAVKSNAGTAVVLVSVFQLMKTAPVIGVLNRFSGKYLQLIIAVVTTLGYVATGAAKGQSWVTAAIEGLFTAGGAMLIYEAYRSIKNK